jgi:hypothetical protein
MGFFRKVEDEIKDAGRKIDDEILQPVKNTVEAIIEDPKKLAAVAISIAFPGAGAALGASLGLTGAAATVVGQTLINTALNGGDVKSAVISAALPVLGQTGANEVTKILANSGIEGTVNTIITRAVTQGATAAILGQDPLAATLLGGVSAGVNAIIPDIPGYSNLPTFAKNAVNSALTAKLTGGSANSAVTQSLVNDAISWAKAEVQKAPSAIEQAKKVFRSDTGKDLTDEAAAELLGTYGANGMVSAADRLSTSGSEAREKWRSIVGTEPTESELMQLIGYGESKSDGIVEKIKDIRSDVFDAQGYATHQDAYNASVGAGYSTYLWNGTEYYSGFTEESRKIEDRRYDLVDQLLKSQGTTISNASDDQLRAAMDKVDSVPTGLLGNATLQDIVAGKYTQFDSDGTLRIEVTGFGATTESYHASKASAQLPRGLALASESEVWGTDGRRNPNVEYMVLPDGTSAFVKKSDGSPIGDSPLRGFTLNELADKDPEAWLKLASQQTSGADKSISDYLVSTADSIMRGAYATGNNQLGDAVKQTLSIVTQGLGEQTENLAAFFTDRLGMDHNSAVAAAGKALKDWGATNQSKSTKDQEAAIISAVSGAKGIGDKIFAFATAVKDNPGGFVTMIAKEGIQEILPLWAAKTAYRFGTLAAVGANTAVEAIESWGAGTRETYDQAKKMGFSEDEARIMASKVGLQSAVITTFTNGVGDTPLVRRIIGDTVKDSVLGITKAGVREGFTEYFDELGQNAVKQYQLTGTVNWDQATTAATIGMGVGAGTTSGIMLGAAINNSAVIGRDSFGNNVSYADFMSGAKQVDMKTLNMNAQVGTAKDGDPITLGGIAAMPMASGISYDMVKSGLPPSLSNMNVSVGRDALGNDVTLASLMSGVTKDASFDTLYKNLLNTTPKQSKEAQTKLITDTFKSAGYTPSASEINALLATNQTGTAAIKNSVLTYVAPRQNPLQKDLNDAIQSAKNSGFGTDEAIKVGLDTLASKIGTNQAGLLAQLGKTTADLKSQFSTDISSVGTQISDLKNSLFNEIRAATDIGLKGDEALQAGLTSLSSKMGVNQTELLAKLGTTEANIRAQFSSEISGVKADLAQAEKEILAQVEKNEQAGMGRDAALQKAINDVASMQKTDAASLLSKLGTTEASLKSQIANLGADMTSQYNALNAAQKANADALVAQGKTMQEAIAAVRTDVTGQISGVESRLSKAIADAEAMGLTRDQAITAAVDSVAADLGTTKEALLAQMGKTEATLRAEFTAGLTNVSADVKAAYDSLTAGQKALADQLTKQGVDLTTAIQTAQQETAGQIGALSADVQAKYNALTAEQKALANDMAEMGIDLTAAINLAQQQTQAQITGLGKQVDARINELMQQGKTYQEATQQAIGELNQQNQQLQALVGTEGRAATQADIDAMNQMLGGQREVDTAYDVTGDKQITQADIDFLTQVVSGTNTNWNPPVGSAFGPTGLYGQIATNEAQRQADLQAQLAREEEAKKAAAEAQRKAAVQGTLSQGKEQLRQMSKQVPQALQMAQTTTTPIYGEMGPYLDLGTPLDVGFFEPSPEKQAATKQQQTTKIAAGGYIDDLLAGDMTADDLLNLLR